MPIGSYLDCLGAILIFLFAVGKVNVLALDRKSFDMVLGPVEDVLKRNMEQYKTYTQLAQEGALPEFVHT